MHNLIFGLARRCSSARMRLLTALFVLPLIGTSFAATEAFAADRYPTKPVRIVVNNPPGGPTDVIARLVAQKLNTSLGQTFYVENKAGAGGNLGAGAVAKADADGHTILISFDAPLTISPGIYQSKPFRSDELKQVILLGTSGLTVAINPSTGIDSLRELVEKSKRQSMTFALGGNGGPGHLATSMLALATGAQTYHIPFSGNAPAVTALLSGEVQAGILATPGLLPHIDSKRVKPLAVTGRQRSALLPNVPTAAESGFPSIELEISYVVMVPAKTPEAIVSILQEAFASAISQPDVRQRLGSLDITPLGTAGPQLNQQLMHTRERYSKIIKASGMKVE
jgi:tripartite-type tricarboxylate transporter receptor subunit TctC